MVRLHRTRGPRSTRVWTRLRRGRPSLERTVRTAFSRRQLSPCRMQPPQSFNRPMALLQVLRWPFRQALLLTHPKASRNPFHPAMPPYRHDQAAYQANQERFHLDQASAPHRPAHFLPGQTATSPTLSTISSMRLLRRRRPRKRRRAKRTRTSGLFSLPRRRVPRRRWRCCRGLRSLCGRDWGAVKLVGVCMVYLDIFFLAQVQENARGDGFFKKRRRRLERGVRKGGPDKTNDKLTGAIAPCEGKRVSVSFLLLFYPRHGMRRE